MGEIKLKDMPAVFMKVYGRWLDMKMINILLQRK
jgi:hypothetical protein